MTTFNGYSWNYMSIFTVCNLVLKRFKKLKIDTNQRMVIVGPFNLEQLLIPKGLRVLMKFPVWEKNIIMYYLDAYLGTNVQTKL